MDDFDVGWLGYEEPVITRSALFCSISVV